MPTPRFSIVNALAIAVLFAACRDSSPEHPPIRVGAILALTGPAAALGDPERDVLLGMAENRAALNGIDLDIRDSGGDTARARVLLDSMAANPNVVAVIGPTTSAESIHLGPRADALEIPLLSLAANKRIVLDASNATRKWVFKFAQNDDLAAERLVAAMRANNHTRVSLLFSDDVFGTGGAEAFRASAGATIQISTDASYPALLANADAVVAGVPNDMPAVVVWGTSPGPALVVKALRADGYAGQIYLSHGNASGAFIADAGAAANGAYVVGSRVLIPTAGLVNGRPQDDVIREFLTLWSRVGSGSPSTFGGHAYDALRAIIEASGMNLRDRNPALRRRELRDRLETLSDFHGVTGTFAFKSSDHAGLTAAAFVLYRIENGQFVVVGS